MPSIPKLTIGMPVFEGESYIAAALDSLLSQTFTDFELLLSDNHSQDATPQICERFAQQDSRIRYTRMATNHGPLANFMHVLSMARSPYFMWAACDDLWDPYWVETLIDASERGDCFAMGAVRQVDEDGNPLASLVDTESFSYANSRIFRRMRYFLRPSMAGKAIAIYGLGPRRYFPEDSAWVLDCQGGDMAFVYCMLKHAPIEWCPSVTFSKRARLVHAEGQPGLQGLAKSGTAWTRAKSALYLLVHTLCPSVYMRVSTPTEGFLLAVLSPIGLARIYRVARARGLI